MSQQSQKICLIITGGTVLPTRSGRVLAVKQESDIQPWFAAMPEVSLIAPDLEVQIFHRSTDADLTPPTWLKTAEFIFQHRAQYSGFVILSSLDNIPYFSSALSLMLENFDRPVVFTGSQMPDYLIADSTGLKEILEASKDIGLRANLINALQVVNSRINGVYIMFGDKLLLGRNIGLRQPLLANPFSYRPQQVVGNVEFSIRLKPDYEQLLKSGAKGAARLRAFLETNIRHCEITPVFHQLDLEGFMAKIRGAVFHLPTTVSYPCSLLTCLVKREPKIPIIFYGRSLILPPTIDKLNVVKVDLEKEGIFILKEENKEWVLVKFMWILGQTSDLSKIRQLLGESPNQD